MKTETQQSKRIRRSAVRKRERLAPAAYWLRDAADEVRRDIAEIRAGRPGFLRTYTADELLEELHA